MNSLKWPLWDYFLLICLIIALGSFLLDFFIPINDVFSLSSYIALFMVYLASEKFSSRNIAVKEKAFSYFMIYWLGACLILISTKEANTIFSRNISYFYLAFIGPTIILQSYYFKKKYTKQLKRHSIVIAILAITAITAIILTLFRPF